MTVKSYILQYKNTHLRIIVALLCMVIVVLLTGCNTTELQVSDEEKSIIELATTIYSDSELEKMDELDSSLEELHKEYPIQCLRKKDYGYRASYRSENDVLVIYFDLDGKETFSKKQPFSKRTNSEFLELEMGKDVYDVMEFDENGDYLFLRTGDTSTKISTHFTIDGYLFELTFDDNWDLKSIYYVLI